MILKILTFLLLQLKISVTLTDKKMCFITEQKHYNCSSLELQRSDLGKTLVVTTFVATDLSLAFNKLGPTISNETFNVFKLLDKTLNLTSNNIEHIESHGFFFNPDFRNPHSTQLKPMKMRVLDLSKNSFQIIPWNSIQHLIYLERLYLSGNHRIKELNDGDLVESKQKKFISLTHIYLNDCKIEFIHTNILKNFNSLKFLDLSENRLRNINEKVGFTLQNLGGVNLNLNNNRLECNCKILWLKEYLIKNGMKNEAKCYKSIKPDPSQTLIETISVNLVNNPNTAVVPADNHKRKNEINTSSNAYALNYKSIITLDDAEFACEMEFRQPNKWFQVKALKDRYEISLKCQVQGYPKPSIRWNENNKSLDKKSTYKTFKIEEIELDSNADDSHIKTVESTLKFFMAMPIRPSLNGFRNYSCRTMLNTPNKMVHPNDEKEIDSNQKMVIFQIYHGVGLFYKSWFSSDPESYDATDRDVYQTESIVLSESYLKKRERPFIYWVILAICLLFALMIVLFATYCIIHNNHKSAKMREELRFLGRSEYSVNKRSAIYLAPPSTNARNHTVNMPDPSLLKPLKPDNIREHQDYSSVYYNQGDRSLSTEPELYSNILFNSPTSLMMKDGSELDGADLPNRNISFDNNPIQSSPIESSNESEDGTKSFDENIEEYQDPEIINLRKPGQGK